MSRSASPLPTPPKRPLSPSSLRDLSSPSAPLARPPSFPAPPTGHDLMLLFPPAPPALRDIDIVAGHHHLQNPDIRARAYITTSTYFGKEERAFFSAPSPYPLLDRERDRDHDRDGDGAGRNAVLVGGPGVMQRTPQQPHQQEQQQQPHVHHARSHSHSSPSSSSSSSHSHSHSHSHAHGHPHGAPAIGHGHLSAHSVPRAPLTRTPSPRQHGAAPAKLPPPPSAAPLSGPNASTTRRRAGKYTRRVFVQPQADAIVKW